MDVALRASLIYHGAAMLPRLRAMSFDERRRMLLQADAHAERQPLHLHREKNLSVPLWGDEPLSGAQVLALMAFGVWVQCGEDENIAGALLDAWPIRDALNLEAASGEATTTREGSRDK